MLPLANALAIEVEIEPEKQEEKKPETPKSPGAAEAAGVRPGGLREILGRLRQDPEGGGSPGPGTCRYDPRAGSVSIDRPGGMDDPFRL